MRKVGIVCAFNPGNTGMFSVDLAARTTLDAWRKDYVLINYQKRRWRLPMEYSVRRKMSDLAKFSHLLFWGDFQNNPVYGVRDFANREVKFGYARTVDQGIANWAGLHLDLAEALRGHTLIASIGNCFLGARDAVAKHALEASVKRFADTAFRILPRETSSTNELIGASGSLSRPNISTGLDPAFLLEAKTDRNFKDGSCFGYCFARSEVQDVAEGLKEIEARTGLMPVEVPWAVGKRRVSQKELFFGALASMQKCRFIVSDVYHLGVNALNHQTPVVLISRQDAGTTSSVDDQKKYALAEQIGATALHLPLSHDASLASQAGRIAEIYEGLMDGQISFDEITAGLRYQKDRFRSSIKEILDASPAGN